MNPKEFWWTEEQQVTVINPTSQPYKFKVHNKDYQLGAGKSAKMPGYIAWVYVYGLASQMCQDDGKFNRWNEEEFRKTYFDKVVAGADPIIEEIAIEEKPLVETLDDEEGDDEEVSKAEAQPKASNGRAAKSL